MPTTVRLADLTTLRLGGPALDFTEVRTVDELRQAVTSGPDPVLIVGGGSNLVVADAGVQARVVKVGIGGIRIDGDVMTIGAGEDWDAVVSAAGEAGLCGLAQLSGIPGSAGATPVQNVGAYGTEISDVLVSVQLLDRTSGDTEEVAASRLRLGYRSSALRGMNRFVVTQLTVRLPRSPRPVRYAELARTLSVPVGRTVPENEVREAVLALRRAKGMLIDPNDPDTRSAGSFFTNPVLAGAELAAAEGAIRDLFGPEVGYPRYPADDGSVKLSAGWLIERAGFGKGFQGPGGRVRVSTKHSLALVNVKGTTSDLLELAGTIGRGVFEQFNVQLRPEPVLIGVELRF